MQFKLRTLLVILGIAPPLLAGALYVTSTWPTLPFIFAIALAFSPLWIPFFLMFLLVEGGVLLHWLFAKQIAADKARVEQLRQSRTKNPDPTSPSDV